MLAACLALHPSAPPPRPPRSCPPQLKKLYADSREDMANSIFVPATSFNCESREPERWSFYLRRLLGAPLGALAAGGGEAAALGWP